MKRFAVVQRCLHGPVAPTGIPGEVLLGARKESLPQGPGQEAKPLSAPGLAQFTNRQRTTWEKHPRLRPKSFSLPQCLCVLLLKAAARGVGGGGCSGVVSPLFHSRPAAGQGEGDEGVPDPPSTRRTPPRPLGSQRPSEERERFLWLNGCSQIYSGC